MGRSTDFFRLYKELESTPEWESDLTPEQKAIIKKEADEIHTGLLNKEVSKQSELSTGESIASALEPTPMKTGAFPVSKLPDPDFALETPGLPMPIMPRVASDTPALALPAKPSSNFAEQALNQLKTPYVKPVPTQEETGAPDALYKLENPILRKAQAYLRENKAIVQPALQTTGAIIGGAAGAMTPADPVTRTIMAGTMAQGGAELANKASQFLGIADAPQPPKPYNPDATAIEGAKQALANVPGLTHAYAMLKSPPMFLLNVIADAANSAKGKIEEGKPVTEALAETGKENAVLLAFHGLSKAAPVVAKALEAHPILAKYVQMVPGLAGTAMETPTLAAAAGTADTNNPVEALQKMAQMPGVPAAAFNAFAMPAADAQRIGAEGKSAKIAETARKMNEGLALIEGKAPEQTQPKAPIVRLPKIEKTDEATNKILADHAPFIESIIKMESAGAKPEEIKAAYDRKIAGIPEGFETYKESLIKSRDEAINDVMELNQEQPKNEPIPAPTLEAKPEVKVEPPKVESIPETPKAIEQPIEKTSSLEPQPEAITPPAKETIKAEPEIALSSPKSESGKVERRLELAQELQSRGLQSIYKKKVKGIGEQAFMKTSEMMERELAEFDAKNPDVAAKAQKVIKKAEPQPINTEIRIRPQMGEMPIAPESQKPPKDSLAEKAQWVIDADDRPYLAKKGENLSGMRSGSKIEISELTGVDISTMDSFKKMKKAGSLSLAEEKKITEPVSVVEKAKKILKKPESDKAKASAKLNTIESLIAEGIYDVAKKGASLIKSGTKDFYQWSKAMMKEYGPKIKGKIVKLWEAAKELSTAGIIGPRRGVVTLKDKLGFKSQPKELFDTNMEKLEADQNKPKKIREAIKAEEAQTELEARKRAGLPMGRIDEVKLTKLEKAKQVIQNILEPVEKAQKIFGKGKEIPEEMDTILAADMVKKRIENQLENIKENGEEPLVEEIHKSNLEYKEAEDWVTAKNALEMNPKIAKINPKFRASATEAGTGMDSGKAALIIAKLTNEGKAERLEKIAEKVYALSAMQREALVKYGLKSPEEIKLWEERKFYVPSKGLPNISDWTLSDRTPLGKGFDQSGQIVKRQLGRKTPSTAPIAHLLEQLNATIIRGERNLVGQKFLAFAEANPDKSLWEINKLEQKQVIDKETGQVIDITDKAAELKDDHLVVYRNGEKFVVKIVDPDMAAGMKKLGAKTNPVLRMVMSLMKKRGATLTSYSPEFALANTPRDAGEMYMNVATDHGPETATKILKSIPSITKQVYQYLRGNKNVEIAADLEEFRKLGGETGYFNLKDVESQQSDIEGKLKDLANPNGIIPLTKKTLNYAVKYLGDISTASELGNRLAVFIELKKKSESHKQLTPIRSAQYGKNVTVNFDREGLGGPWIKALWLFANAGIQGTARIAEAMSDLPKNTAKGQRSRKLVGSAIAGSAMLDQWNAAMSDDWDKMEQKYKNVNMTLMFPGGYRLMVPLPYGYAPLHTFGQQMSAMARGKMQPSEAAKNMVLAAASAFNPLGGDDDPRLWLLPTLAELPIETAFNKKIFTGKPIVPEQMPFGPKKPDSERYPKGTSKHLISLTREANRLTGGDAVTPGAVDVSPATLEYLADYLGGSIGRTLRQTGQIALDTPGYISGETPLPMPHQIPGVRRYFGGPTPYPDNKIFYDTLSDLGTYKAQKKIKTNKPEDAWKEKAIIELEGVEGYRKYSLKKQIADLEDKITVESEKGNSREAEKLKDQVFQLKKKFNKRVEELKQGKK